MVTAPLKIGRHEWRIVVNDHVVLYAWRPIGAPDWRHTNEWPRDLPAGLKRLYALNVQDIMEAMQ